MRVWAGWATRGEAAVWLAEVVAALPGSDAPAGPTIETVGVLLRSWGCAQVSSQDISGSSHATQRTRTRHPTAWVASVPLDQIQIETLECLRDARLLEGDSPQTVAHELIALRLAWTWGQEGGQGIEDRRAD